jgi:dTDP-4-amino-4,6-dideoxygalactose transaminase
MYAILARIVTLAMKVPLLDLKANHAPIEEELLEAVAKVVKSGHYILGPEVDRFEAEAALYCRAKYALGVSSGTDALVIALMALGIGPGDEVLVPSYSFFATAGAVSRVGAKPVFVDVERASFNIDPAGLVKAVTKKTRAVIPVHLYGQVAAMEEVLAAAKKYKLFVIEDAAQAIGADHPLGRAGTLGDIGCLSFFPSKNLGALGDAGMVTTNDKTLFDKLKRLRVHGSEPKYYHAEVGGNFRIDAIQSAALRVKLKHLDAWTKGRQTNAARYEELFKKAGLLSLQGFELPARVWKNAKLAHDHIYNQFVLRVPKRDQLRAHLKTRDVDTEIYYPVPLHLQQCFEALGKKKGDLPQSERAADTSLALPIYPELTAEMQEYVVAQIADYYR